MSNAKRQAFSDARVALPDGQWARLIVKAAFGVLLAALFGWLLINRLADISFDHTQDALLGVTAAQWIVAALATFASFWAVGHYDGAIHRYLATGISPLSARRAGATSIAVSQTLGLGVITGAIVRWRMLPDLSLWQATKLTSLVAVFFLFGWAFVTATVLLVVPHAPFKGVAVCTVLVMPAAICLGARHARRRARNWPNLFILSRLVALTAVDTLAAALALWALCPPDLAIPFATLLPAFLIAFGAGLLSGTPGGVGAFEITLLALLPQVPEAPLLAAILAWRGIYFACPALIGAAVAMRGPKTRRNPLHLTPHGDRAKTAKRAETRLLAQGQLQLGTAGHDQAWLTGRTPHCLIGLLDPLLSQSSHDTELGCVKQAVAALVDTAISENRLAVIYKCSARTAVAARRLGLTLRKVAREAWLDPRNFTLSTAPRAGLRRKLRHAEKAGVTLHGGPHDPRHLTRVADEWKGVHGRERGFSIGRFDMAYLAEQRVYLAMRDSAPIAFVSFHAGKYEWTLDLMRQTSPCPDGTMHALIASAIADAAALDLPRLSLAAVPLAALAASPKGRIAKVIHHLLGGNHAGLAQFKLSFAPRWQTLYLAAPHKAALAIAGLEIAREVHFPRPLAPVTA